IIVVVLAATASHVFRNRIGFDHGRHFAGRAFVVFAVRRLDGRCLGGRRLDLFYLLARTAAAGLCLRLFGLDGFNLDRASIFGCFCASLFRRRRLIVDDGLFGFSGIGDWFGRGGRFGVCDHLLLVGLGLHQRLPVGERDLIVVGMDFRKGEEAVPIAAVIDERGLQRGFDPRHLCQVNVAADLLLVLGLEIEFFDAVAAN